MANKKLSNKKPLAPTLKIPPQVQAKISAEYWALYAQKRKELESRLGGEIKGIYYRWFDEEMWHEYQSIRDKYVALYNKTHNKTIERNDEKECL